MKKVRVVAIDVNVTSLPLAVKEIFQMVALKQGVYICVANVHMCMEAFDSPSYQEIINSADYVLPDGKPLSVAQKLLTSKSAKQVRGQDIMNELCYASSSESLRIGLYGGSSDELLSLVKSKLIATFPGINISYAFSPPFRALTDIENKEVIKQINEARVDILFVGTGCPKQEIWMADHKKDLTCVMLGVGAAYDFISGSKKHAPRWVQDIGMEWMFRLLSEPQRLWRRYLKQNPRFVWYFLGQWLLKKNY